MFVESRLGHKLNKRLKLVAVNSKTKKKGNRKSDEMKGGKVKNIVSDIKKKRVYADGDVDEEVTRVKAPLRKALSKKGQIKLKAYVSEDKNINRISRSMWTTVKKKGSASLDLKTNVKAGKTSCNVLKTKNLEIEEKRDGQKKSTKLKTDSKKLGDRCQTKHPDASSSSLKSLKKALSENTVLDDDSESWEDQRKNRKRIRIDPHDLSNKRLDDAIVLDEGSKEKKKVAEEKSPRMSMNAQFRAIRPSPSILSFVEENLLGRRRLIELRRGGYNIEFSAPLDNLPFSTSTERDRIEESIFRNKLTFFAAAKVSSSFPPADVPEIAFAGRSNVGKSSLLNSLTRQWGVARTSDKPGLTQTINFFGLGPKLRLVDLPGYGFAYAKDEVKDAWEELVKEYVSTRAGLKRVCLLIDTKWGMKPRDHELIDLMERSHTMYQVILTKTDMVFPIDVARRAMQIEESLKANKSVVQPVMMVSSKSGAGIRTLRTVLAKIARFAKA